jgi:uncharacterized membrane-anchored protein
MTRSWTSRRARVLAACLLQLVLVGVAVAPSLSARVTGEEYLLAVAPVDPIDPFRGAYVTLDYPGLQQALPEDGSSPDGTVFVPLERVPGGDLWQGRSAQRQRPADGPYLRCEADYRLACGIESLFASQASAKRLERELADGAVARIRVDDRGNAAVIGLQPKD